VICIPIFRKAKFLRNSSDLFLDLLVLLLRILYSGISDSGLLAHLLEVTVGSLKSVRPYEELAMYNQLHDAVRR